MASACPRTARQLWVTSIPQNAVFTYDSLADLRSLVDTIKLPDLQIPGKRLGGAVANWVTFTPNDKIYIANSGLRSVTAIDMKSEEDRGGCAGRRSAQAHQYSGHALNPAAAHQ